VNLLPNKQPRTANFWHNRFCMSSIGFRLTSLIPRLALAGLLAVLLIGVDPSARAQQSTLPTVKMTFDFPGSEPEHFVFSVSSDGHAVYDSNGKLTPQSEAGEPFHLEFTMSAPTRERIFHLAKQAHYFQGDIDSKLPNIANTGAKTLSYTDAKRHTQASYNYSSVPAVRELTALFQSVSATLEFGRRLQSYHRYQKLALDDELRSMEEMQKDHMLAELPAVAPILQSIAKDPTVMNVVRGRCLRLLQQAGMLAFAPNK
jgi:hypothetical protein